MRVLSFLLFIAHSAQGWLFPKLGSSTMASGKIIRAHPPLTTKRVCANEALDLRRAAASVAVGLGLGLMITGPPLQSIAEEATFAQQLRAMQEVRTTQQRLRLEEEDHEMLTRELLMPEGALIARGVLTLESSKMNPETFPLGLETADALDPIFANPNARLFILCVGRESTTPLAAKSMPLAGLKFPLMYEVEDKDLLFPYTAQAWRESPGHLDTIAVSAFLTPEDKLSVPNPSIRVSFALNEPKNFAGKLTRGNADIKVGAALPVDTAKFTEEEVAVLKKVDDGIAKNMGSSKKM